MLKSVNQMLFYNYIHKCMYHSGYTEHAVLKTDNVDLSRLGKCVCEFV